MRYIARRLHAGLLGLMLFAFGANDARAEEKIDLELVLAVDISLSMDQDEQRLQRNGYISAFRHPDIIAAIKSGGYGRIAVSYIEWAGVDNHRVIVPWTFIDSAETANKFASKLETEDINSARRTSISSGLLYASKLFENNGYEGIRRVVDVSGDGPNNMGPAVHETRDLLISKGIVINGLPVTLKANDPAGFYDVRMLEFYYEDCVIGGFGSFLVAVRDRKEFAIAIRRKLILEIAGARPRIILAQTQVKPPREKTDCLIGEKIWDIGWD